jgi:hypothetical protein
MASTVAKDWVPCPAGELDRLTAYVRFVRLRKTLITIAAAAAATIAVAAASWAVASTVWPPTPSAAALPCSGAAPVQPCKD